MKKAAVVVILGLALYYGFEEKEPVHYNEQAEETQVQEADTYEYYEFYEEEAYDITEDSCITYDAPETVEENEYDAGAWSDDHDTAPMPETIVAEDDLIGFWTRDPDEVEPIVMEFYRENGVLKYRYFRVQLGNGNGIGLAKEHTIFEFNSGNVNLLANQGNCYCMVGDSEKVYISFYCFDPQMETIVDQEDGTVFYRWNDFSMPEV